MDVKLSIIVPCRGRGDLLARCLKSLISQRTSASYEILAVYCEADVEVAQVVVDYPSIRSIVSPVFLSAGLARNLGAEHAQADVLAFIDSDCILDPNWVSLALEMIAKGAVMFSGSILDAAPWNMIASADNRLQYADFAPGRPYGIATYFPGPHLGVRKKEFWEAGGFSIHAHGQDVLFTMKVAAKYPEQTIFNPKLRVRHHGRAALREFLEHQKRFGAARTQERIQLSAGMTWLIERSYLGGLIFLRRFLYITWRVLVWNWRDLPRFILQLPLFCLGLYAWTVGFYEGAK